MTARRLLAWIALPVACLLAAPERTAAEEAERSITVPRAKGLVLDGELAEPAWSSAAVLETDVVTAPFPPTDPKATAPERRSLKPDVRVLVAEGLHQLQAEVPHVEMGQAHPHLGEGLALQDRQPQGVAVEAQGLLGVLHRDGDVIKLLKHPADC